MNGLRNRDLRKLLYPKMTNAKLRLRQAAAITRRLALLRAHGILQKVSALIVTNSQKPDNESLPLCLPLATATSTSLPKWLPKNPRENERNVVIAVQGTQKKEK